MLVSHETSIEEISIEVYIQRVIDELDFGLFHYILFTVVGLSWAVDVAELFSSGLLIPILKIEFEIESNIDASYIASAPLLGMLVGSWLFGVLGDMIGRKKVLSSTCLGTFICAIVCSLTTTYSQFLFNRVLLGIFLGGNLPVAFSLFLEFCPSSYRDRMTLYLTGWSIVGTLYASCLRFYLNDWRELIRGLAIPSGVLSLVLWSVPESPRFSIINGHGVGCVNSLQFIARWNNKKIAQDEDRIIRNHQIVETPHKNRVVPVFADPQTKYLVAIWSFSGLGFYGFQSWAPSAITASSDDSNALYYILVGASVFQLASLCFAPWSMRYLGYENTLAVFLACDALAVFWFGYVSTFEGMFIAYSLFNFGTAGFFGVLYLVTTIRYPTEIRTTAFGICSSFNRVFGTFAATIVGLINVKINPSGGFLFVGIMFFCATIATMRLPRKHS